MFYVDLYVCYGDINFNLINTINETYTCKLRSAGGSREYLSTYYLLSQPLVISFPPFVSRFWALDAGYAFFKFFFIENLSKMRSKYVTSL